MTAALIAGAVTTTVSTDWLGWIVLVGAYALFVHYTSRSK